MSNSAGMEGTRKVSSSHLTRPLARGAGAGPSRAPGGASGVRAGSTRSGRQPGDGKTGSRPAAGSPGGLDTPAQYVKGVGPRRAADLARLGVTTVGDLLRHLPRRHEDRSRLKPIAMVLPDTVETVKGRVLAVTESRPRRGLTITKVSIGDGTATLQGVWFNQPFIKKNLRAGETVVFSGRVERHFGHLQMNGPEYEVLDGADPLNAGRIVPVYRATEGLSQRYLRAVIKGAADAYAGLMPEALPAELRQRLGLLPAPAAWRAIHFPADEAELDAARRRLAFEELFLLQLGLGLVKQHVRRREPGFRHGPDGDLVRRFLAALPFRLTAAQERVVREIKADMESPHPMNRLVQGDVGSGKTVVAALALLKAVESGAQGAMMAPTEILAEQHYLRLRRLLEPLGVGVALLTGGQGREERQAALFGLSAGHLQVAIGTHALIQEGVAFKRLSLVITDEQHRFGVRQRALLQEKGTAGGIHPDVLVMTATPIPRTLALTLFGDLDVSVIDELPPGRRPLTTRWLSEKDRGKAYGFVREQVRAGRQAYVICPLVEESDAIDARAAIEWAARLEKALPEFRVGVLHGRLKAAEKEAVMDAFQRGEVQILVATTVVEVGVDVPNATVIVIEGADRFGLAQLHQLRGRVGRGEHPSYCLLIADPSSEDGRSRMAVMTRTADGFAIAEEDLQLRGPGEFFGTRQHGLPDLLVANPVRDLPILEEARQEAFALLEADPSLARPEHAVLRQAVRDRFRGRLALIGVG